MTAIAEATPKMMRGTEGREDYLVIARKASVALGIKPNAIVKGVVFGHPGTIWFGARLRSAPAGDLFKGDTDAKVVKFEKEPANLWDAWPGVEWERRTMERASTQVGILLEGSLDGTLKEAHAILDQLKDGTLAHKLAEYLTTLAGPEAMILSVDQIKEWLMETHYKKLAVAIEQGIKQREVIQEDMSKSIGTFGMQAKILKEAYEKVKSEADEDEFEDEDLDDEEDYDDPA